MMNEENDNRNRKEGGDLLEDEYELSKARKKSSIKELINFILYIFFVFALAYLIINYVGQRTQVSGSSMEATLQDGDNLIVDKISYRFVDPKRYDIIVFPYHYAEKTFYIKRIIGLPGEKIRVAYDGSIFIDGDVLDENFGREVIRDPGTAAEEIQLGEDEYFVMGDNRNASSDSRDPSVGLIKRDEIIGRAWVRIFPFNKVGFIKHQ